MAEKNTVIVTLTSYGPRLGNLPTVLDTIYRQTVPPDFVVLNLAHNEIVPTEILNYLSEHNVEINRVEDTRVYKKLIPTLKKYPNDTIISIDDDWLYPKGMIADFLEIHHTHPDNPISGNRLVYHEMICHCGCASLTKAEYFQPYLDVINNVIPFCPCDDIVYTYFANKAGHPYIVTHDEYFTNMTPFNEGEGYSESIEEDSLSKSLSYLINKYGEAPHYPNGYIEDKYLADILYRIYKGSALQIKKDTAAEIRATHAYRIGRKILKPFSFIKRRTI